MKSSLTSIVTFLFLLSFTFLMSPSAEAGYCPDGETSIQLFGTVQNTQRVKNRSGHNVCVYQIKIDMVPEPRENPECPIDRGDVGNLMIRDATCTRKDGAPISGTLVMKNGIVELF